MKNALTIGMLVPLMFGSNLVAWTQPIGITNSGTGGSSVAIFCSTGGAPTGAFDRNYGWNDGYSVNGIGLPHYIGLYSPVPLNPTNIAITNRNYNDGTNFAIATGYVQMSYDGTNWVNVATISNGNNGQNATWNIPISTTMCAKYIRVYATSIFNQGVAGFYFWVSEFVMTAKQLV